MYVTLTSLLWYLGTQSWHCYVCRQDAEGKEIRQVKGVMRVGDLAKGLLLSNNLNIELVVLCTEKPTKPLLTKVHQILPGKLKVGSLTTRIGVLMLGVE